MTEIDGATLVARCLKQQGLDELLGVVGVPVTGIAVAAHAEGIRYIGMRHEQAAGYRTKETRLFLNRFVDWPEWFAATPGHRWRICRYGMRGTSVILPSSGLLGQTAPFSFITCSGR